VRNIKLTLTYDGTNFSGFELQPGKKTIRGEIEKALYKLFKTRIKTISASRTDSGVHACAQVVAFALKSSIPTSRIAAALNSVLPEDIRVIKAEARGRRPKAKGFNARYDAKSKTYEYLIFNGDPMPVHLRKLAWQVKPKLNIAAMKKAGRGLVGKHDFSSFCASGSDDKDFVRIIHSFVISHSSLVIWQGVKYPVIRIRVTGSGFLYKMVRNLVGTMVEVGLGRRKLTEVRHILHAKDRKKAGRTAPAHGLCLVRVNY
jgi:tRNA pseudouridine38-40 synthase